MTRTIVRKGRTKKTGKVGKTVKLKAKRVVTKVKKATKLDTKISRIRAYELMKNSKGKFFTATFIKKDGTKRTMNCQWLPEQEEPKLGYVKVKDAVLIKKTPKACTRSINLQTISTLKVNGKHYKIS